MGDRELLERILHFKRDHLVHAVEHRAPVPEVDGALLLTTPSLPDVWELNVVLAEAAPDRLTVERLLRACERHQRPTGVRHRALRLASPTDPAVLRGPAHEADWVIDRDVVMVLRRPPDRPPADGFPPVLELDVAALTVAEDAFLRSEPAGRSPVVRSQLVEQGARWDSARPGTRRLGITTTSVGVVAWCRIYDDGELCEIDSVSVLPEARGQGLGRALMEGAIAAVPADRVLFLCADPNDWPRELYLRLGFDVIGDRVGATRPPRTRRLVRRRA